MPTYDRTIFTVFLRYLILAAQNKRVVPYHEIENAIGLSHNMVGYYAGLAGDFCGSEGWPLLNALLVNTTTCQPSDGFAPYQNATGLSWGDCLSQVWTFFHLKTSREKQVENFSGLNRLVARWDED